MRIRCYNDLRRIETLEERYHYLRVPSQVGVDTFGFERWLNQTFYRSAEWRHVRQKVIARDLGCDLGIEGYEIFDAITVHHMNPVTVRQVTERDPAILDPEYLISVSHRTHNAIHFGSEDLLVKPLVQRHPGDTKLW